MNNNSPTSVLRKEHERVLLILDKLEENLREKDINSIEKNITILENEFDKHSLNKEEKALFLEIEKFIPRNEGPTGMMIVEHKDLTESIKKFKVIMKIKDFEKLKQIGEHIIYLLRQHIDKENNILFTIAEMHLDSKQKEIILKKFRKIDLMKK